MSEFSTDFVPLAQQQHGGSKGAPGMGVPGGPNSFIFMQFSAKNRLAHPLWELVSPPLRKILNPPLPTAFLSVRISGITFV